MSFDDDQRLHDAQDVYIAVGNECGDGREFIDHDSKVLHTHTPRFNI